MTTSFEKLLSYLWLQSLNISSYLNYELSSGNCVCMDRHIHANNSCQHCSFGSSGCTHCSYDDGNNGQAAYDSSLFTCL